MIAALFVERGGPYFRIPGVDPWDLARDAMFYAGPHPAIAHPPCGPWGALKHLYKGPDSDRDCAPAAVELIRKWGGVLEHPSHSQLWSACNLPGPDASADRFGGKTIAVNQVEWGHACAKPTWLYLVGMDIAKIAPPFPGRRPTHGIWYGKFERSGHAGPPLLCASKEIRRRTPMPFARWLVSLCRSIPTQLKFPGLSPPTPPTEGTDTRS